MTKNIYSTEQIEYLKATQHGIAMTSEHSPFIDTQRKIINAQTYRFLQSVINKEINIKTQDWPLVEELAEELLRSSNFLNRYKVNKVIKQIEQLASSANAAQANLKQSLNDIDALSVLLKDKQQLRSLSTQDLMTARQTIAQAKLNNNKRRFLSAQLQNAARIHYIKLKSNQTFNANNPLHTKFEQSFNLQSTKISPRSKAQTETQHPIELHISQPAPQKAASVSKEGQREWILGKLSAENKAVYESLPVGVAAQLTLERDPHGNVQVSLIETEKLLSEMVATKLEGWKKEGKYVGKFSPLHHFFGYEGRCAAPSNYDADYCYALGTSAAMLMANGKTGYMAIVKNTTAPAAEWVAGGVPITMMMNMERRHGEMKPVIKKALVRLDGAPFKTFAAKRDKWARETCFVYPGPIQYFGPSEVCDQPTKTLQLEQAK